ncbi:chaplin [Streptomyces sp. NPDC020681]|uniref:chaplin n=1 Tax=Streptomyces sp. NPDC020681 TaxID=3365083 RepID=UPI00379F7E13
MRQVTRKGLITMAAAGGVLALGGGYAHADSGAAGTASNSPGVLSGNNVQVPVNVPVNVCGNTVNVVALLNPAFGNGCANKSDSGHGNSGHGKPGGGSHAGGSTSNSPGVGSGNNVQAPIDVPVNACGNAVTIGGLGNPAMGNECANDSGAHTPPGNPGHPEEPGNPGNPDQPGNPGHPGVPGTPGGPLTPDEQNAPGAQSVIPPMATDELAQTGSGPLGLIVPAGAGLLLAGAVLYRRARAAA